MWNDIWLWDYYDYGNEYELLWNLLKSVIVIHVEWHDITMIIESIDSHICWMIWKLIWHYESVDWTMNDEIAMIMEMNMEHAEKCD